MMPRDEALKLKAQIAGSSFGLKPIYLPEITHIEELFPRTQMYKKPAGKGGRTPEGVYIWNGGGFLDGGNWYSLYGYDTPMEHKDRIEACCTDARWVSVEVIPQHDSLEGWALVVGRDGNCIARPWLTIIETQPYLDWIAEQKKQEAIQL